MSQPDLQTTKSEAESSNTSLDTSFQPSREAKWFDGITLNRKVVAVTTMCLTMFAMKKFSSRVVGSSMEPAIANGALVLTFPLTSELPERFDTVVFIPPDYHCRYVKRVCGLPGESIEVNEKGLHINGNPLSEPFETFGPTDWFGPIDVPEGSVFVLGDHRHASHDSREFGPVEMRSIEGVVWYVSESVSHARDSDCPDCAISDLDSPYLDKW